MSRPTANDKKPASRLIAISNIAWSGNANDRFFDLLVEEGVKGLELAASLIWPEPIESTAKQRASFRASVEMKGLSIIGLHSLLFARNDLQLLTEGLDRLRVLEYLKRTIDLCAELGGHSLVLGSPKNRKRGRLSPEEANKRGASILHELGEYAINRNCFFALETLPGPTCDFITTLEECESLIALAGTRGIRPHFDTGAASVTNSKTPDEWLVRYLSETAHCQINDFELLPPGTKTPSCHSRWARLLAQAKYNGWFCIEMRRSDESVEDAIRHAIRFVQSAYLLSKEN